MFLSRCCLRRSDQFRAACQKNVTSSSTQAFLSTQRSLRSSPQLKSFSGPISSIYTRPQTYKANFPLQRNGFARFLSTTPTSAQMPPPASSAVPHDAPAGTQLSSETSASEALELSADALLRAEECIGYLKSVGLDWGWGPTSVMEYIVEHIHVYTGSPWWLTIVLTAVLLRAALFKPYIVSAENAARMAVVAPITKPLMQKMMEAQRAGDTAALFQVRHEQGLIHRRAGIKTWKAGIPLIQMVLGFGTFRLLNGMAKLNIPGLETGGALWFTNLTVPDPLYILPAATAATLHWVMRKGGENGVQMMKPQILALMKWGLPCVSLIFTSWLPSSVQLSFFVSGVLSLIQSTLLQKTWFRSYFNMTPLPGSTVKAPEVVSSYQGSINVDQNRVLSLAEISQRFQAPNLSRDKVLSAKLSEVDPTPEIKKESKVNQILTGAVKIIRGTVQEVIKAGRGLAGETKKEVQSRLDKAEIRQRELYEKKKQDEAWLARIEEQKQRQRERAMRKAGRTAK